jgi:glucokinase
MAKQKVYALGIDLGGTKTLVAFVDVTTDEVIASERRRTHAEKGQEYMSQHITHLSTAALESAQLPAGAEIVAVGVGAAGQIDRKNGVVVDAPNLGV